MGNEDLFEIPELFERDDYRLLAIIDALDNSNIDCWLKMIVKPPTFLNGGGAGMPEPEEYALWIRRSEIQKVADLIIQALVEQPDESTEGSSGNCPACGGLVGESGRCRSCRLVVVVNCKLEDDRLLAFAKQHRSDTKKTTQDSDD